MRPEVRFPLLRPNRGRVIGPALVQVASVKPDFVEPVADADALRSLIARSSAEQRIVERARIVLARVFEGLSLKETRAKLGVSAPTVRKWVARFTAAPVLSTLEDGQRSGRPATINLQSQAVVITLACQRPEDVERLEGQMTQEIIREEAAARGAVMSRSSVQRILALSEVQPHRERYYLFTPKDGSEYTSRRDAICAAYTRPLPADEVVLCFDEKTGIQALGIPHGAANGGRRPPSRGHVGRLEHNYVRHGSRSLVAVIRPDTGELVAAEVYAPKAYKTDQAIALLRHIAWLFQNMRVIHLVWDNGSTHRSAKMKEFLASVEGQRFNLLYTPTHASWLNLAENFFSRFSRRYLAGRRYDSVDALEGHLLNCAMVYNSVARPMRWKYNPAEREAA